MEHYIAVLSVFYTSEAFFFWYTMKEKLDDRQEN